MYAIMSGGALVALCDKPRYVRRNPSSGAYIEAAREEAEAIAVRGDLYNLPGSDIIPDAPEALVSEAEIPEFVFQNQTRITANESAVAGAEDALCEQDSAADTRLGALEDAICELDAAINQ